MGGLEYLYCRRHVQDNGFGHHGRTVIVNFSAGTTVVRPLAVAVAVDGKQGILPH